MLVVRTKVVKTDGMIKIVGRIMAPSSLRALWPPYLTVPAKDGLSSRGLNLADTAHGGRGEGGGGELQLQPVAQWLFLARGA